MSLEVTFHIPFTKLLPLSINLTHPLNCNPEDIYSSYKFPLPSASKNFNHHKKCLSEKKKGCRAASIKFLYYLILNSAK